MMLVAAQIRDSVQRFAEGATDKEQAVKPEAVSEEGVLHLFGPDGMLVIQYDATMVPPDVAKSNVSEMQDYEQQAGSPKRAG